MSGKNSNGRLGWRKPEGTREQHQVRAYPDEWEIIQAFSRIVKRGDKQAAAEFVKAHSTRVESAQ